MLANHHSPSRSRQQRRDSVHSADPEHGGDGMANRPEKDYILGGDKPTRVPPPSRTFTQGFEEATRNEPPLRAERPWGARMESPLKNHIVAALGELVGTLFFLLLAFSGTAVGSIPTGSSNATTAATKTASEQGFNVDNQLYIALAFGFSLMVNVWVFYRISGGLFNPAVTLALTLIGAVTPARALFVFLAQIIGGIAAAGIASALYPTPVDFSTSLGPGTTLAQGFFIEMVLTFQLVFTIFMLAAEKHRATFVAPVGIGLALFICEMAGVYYTGGSLNPARSFGPCVVTAEFPKEHWIYWAGPVAGSLLATALYKIIKILQYELANPGQDSHE